MSMVTKTTNEAAGGDEMEMEVEEEAGMDGEEIR